jgi:type IV secretory pathway VirB4 component
MNKERLFINRFFVTLALRPSVHGADKLVQLFKNKARAEAEADAIDADLLEALEDKARDFEKLMDRCSPRRLSIYGHNGLKFSETMEVAEMVMTGRHRRVPIIRGTSAARLSSTRRVRRRDGGGARCRSQRFWRHLRHQGIPGIHHPHAISITAGGRFRVRADGLCCKNREA